MPLLPVDLSIARSDVPHDVRALIREAERRIERFQRDSRVPGFVASDFLQVYRVLQALSAADLATGSLFCEWGSGFGVVSCLAALLDFDACGIEIDAELVSAAQQLAADFDLPVEFIRGSFIPPGAAISIQTNKQCSWLTTEEDGTHEELGLTPDDFSVIFAYPWPDEEQVIDDLFEQYAATGAILVNYHGGDELRLSRKVAGKTRGLTRERRAPLRRGRRSGGNRGPADGT
jgi:hypothetical protein